jgi:hypothetical protein
MESLHIELLKTTNVAMARSFKVYIFKRFRLIAEFTEILFLVTASNSKSLAALCTLQITIARAQFSDSAVSTSRCLVTDPPVSSSAQVVTGSRLSRT